MAMIDLHELFFGPSTTTRTVRETEFGTDLFEPCLQSLSRTSAVEDRQCLHPLSSRAFPFFARFRSRDPAQGNLPFLPLLLSSFMVRDGTLLRVKAKDVGARVAAKQYRD